MSRSYLFSRDRFSRIEALVAFVLFLIVACTVCGVGSDYLRLHGTERAVESARTLNTLLAQYATDNNGVYPVGEGTRAEGKSEGIALDLLQNNYSPNADIFSVGSTLKYDGAAKDYADLGPENMSWDFTAGATTTTGITSAAADLLPVLYTTGETVDYASAVGHGLKLTPSGKGPFGNEGIVVAYKGGNALFIKTSESNQVDFVLPEFKDTGTYTQIRP